MIAIVNYGVGNLRAVQNMLRKAGAQSVLATTADEIAAADRLILPGVGHFGHAVTALRSCGLVDAVERHALEKKRPLLGICVGAQMLGHGSEEAPGVTGLGWLPFSCRRFPQSATLRVPHMSWNMVDWRRPAPICPEAPQVARYYFVHSFYMTPCETDILVGETEYGLRFASIVGRDNMYAVQFHPEKSHRFGLELLRRFAEMPVAVA